MAARIHKIKNIYSRIDGLIRKGHMKPEDRPLWFDVYKSFPPKYEPTFKRKAPETTVKEILYKEDILRAKIHREFSDKLGFYNLNSNKEAFGEKLLKTYQQYISEGLTEHVALEKLKLTFVDSSQITPSSELPSTRSNINEILKTTLP